MRVTEKFARLHGLGSYFLLLYFLLAELYASFLYVFGPVM